LFDPSAWPAIGPLIAALNRGFENTGLHQATVTMPLTVVLALLLIWILIRLVRFRRQVEERGEKGEPIQAVAEEEAEIEVEPEPEPEPSVEIEPESFQEQEPEEEIEPEDVQEPEPEPEVIPEPEPEPEPEVISEPEPEIIPEPEPAPKPAPKLSLFARLRRGLSKTAGGLVGRIDKLVRGRRIDEDFFAELEEILFTADLGPATAEKLLTRLQERVQEENIEDAAQVRTLLQEEIAAILEPHQATLEVERDKPFVIMVVGVNGVGKTTTIGKVAKMLSNEGKKVIFGAADTFRAAADEQLQIWADRAGADIVKQAAGADPAAVAYDTVQAAINRELDVAIIDTAGRLHTKHNLMEELKKVKRVMAKIKDTAPQEVLLVLDANTGQNAIAQAKTFHQALGLTGIILTKLDGTAKGGCIVGICDELEVPVRYIGIGEQMDDLRPFIAADFVRALFDSAEG